MKAGGRLAALLLLAACGTAPPPRDRPPVAKVAAPEPPPTDPCAELLGKPPVPLTKQYSGVLKRARCQGEVLSIMNGVAKALGVGCAHCHDEADYAKSTPKKEVANWMARELMPRLAKRSGGDTTCADCHADDGKGKAKILGSPRSRQRAVEWMTVRLVERFDTAAGGPLYCATCHVRRLGDPAFDPHVIFTEHLPPLPVPPAAAPPVSVTPASTSAPSGVEGARMATPQRGNGELLALGLSWLAYATYYLGRKAFSALKKPLEHELGILPGALGAIDTAFLAAYTVGQFASGFAGDRFGARRLVGYGMLVSSVACLGFGLSGGAMALGAWFFLNGLAQLTGWPGTTRIVAEWTTRENRGTVMGLWSTCYQLGGLSATLLAGQLAVRFGWRSAMFVPAAAILAVGVVVLVFLPRPPALVLAPSDTAPSAATPGVPPAAFRAQLDVLRSRTLWSFGASYFFIKLVRYALLFWLPYYLATTRGYSTGKAANVSIAFDAGGIVGVVVIGWLADRRRLSHAALSMLSIALLVPVLAGHRGLGVAGELGEVLMLALAGALLVGPESLLTGVAAQEAGGPAAAATATGFVNGLGSFGALLQGLVVPPLAARFGWTALFPVLGALALGAVVALLPTLRASRGSR